MMKLLPAFLLTFVLFSLSFAQEKRVLSLEECINIAVENNLTIRRSRFDLETSRINLVQAKGQRYPTFNLNGNYGYNWGRGIDPTTNQFTTQRINFNGVSGNSSMPLIRGLQVNHSIKQGKLNVEAGEYDVKRAIYDISLNIALIYLNVILNQELLENTRFQLKSSEQQLERTKKMVKLGVLPISNELQLASQTATNEVDVINAENNLDLAFLDLKQALLLPHGEEVEIIVPDIAIDQTEIEASSVSEIYEIALANMPEIKSADLRVQSARMGFQASRGSVYPTLSLNGAFNTNYSDVFDQQFVPDGTSTVLTQVPTDFETATGIPIVENVEVQGGTFENYAVFDQWDDNLNYSVSLGLSFRIFNGFATQSDIQRSRIGVQQAEILALEERNNLYQNIETAYRNALAAAKTYSASLKQVASLQETYRAIENQFNLGAANFTDYQVASNDLFRASSDLSRAKYDFIFRQKILEFYQGKPLSY